LSKLYTWEVPCFGGQSIIQDCQGQSRSFQICFLLTARVAQDVYAAQGALDGGWNIFVFLTKSLLLLLPFWC